jgi:hypothetical protein
LWQCACRHISRTDNEQTFDQSRIPLLSQSF